jgi:hypothetical protein
MLPSGTCPLAHVGTCLGIFETRAKNGYGFKSILHLMIKAYQKVVPYILILSTFAYDIKI